MSTNNNHITSDTRREAEKTVDKQQRYCQILQILYGRQMTAKEIAFEMYREGFIPTSERNFTAPRLTELEKDGKVKVVGKKKCEYTGRTVAVYALSDKYDVGFSNAGRNERYGDE